MSTPPLLPRLLFIVRPFDSFAAAAFVSLCRVIVVGSQFNDTLVWKTQISCVIIPYSTWYFVRFVHILSNMMLVWQNFWSRWLTAWLAGWLTGVLYACAWSVLHVERICVLYYFRTLMYFLSRFSLFCLCMRLSHLTKTAFVIKIRPHNVRLAGSVQIQTDESISTVWDDSLPSIKRIRYHCMYVIYLHRHTAILSKIFMDLQYSSGNNSWASIKLNKTTFSNWADSFVILLSWICVWRPESSEFV